MKTERITTENEDYIAISVTKEEAKRAGRAMFYILEIEKNLKNGNLVNVTELFKGFKEFLLDVTGGFLKLPH